MARIFDIDTPPENIPDKPKKNSFGWRIPSQQELRPVEGFATEPEPAERDWGTVGLDSAKSFAKGSGTLIKSIGWLTGNETLEEIGRDAEAYWSESQSAYLKSKLAKVEQAEGFIGKLSAFAENPAAMGDAIVQSIPMMIPGMGVGALSTRAISAVTHRLALRAGANAEVAAAAAQKAALRTAIATNVTGEGAVSGGATGSEVESFAKAKGATTEEAKRMANEAALKAGLWTAAGAMVGAGMESRAMLGQMTDKGVKGLAKNTAKEAGEEMLQNPGESYAAYEQKVKLDPTQKFDLGGSMAEGLVTGGPMGAGFHVAGALGSRGEAATEAPPPGDAPAQPTPVQHAPPSTPPEQPPVDTNPDLQMQNRDRGTAASVVQVKSIANAPDFDRLGASPIADVGAPLVSIKDNADGALDQGDIGNGGTITLPDGAKVDFRYAVVDANAVLTSHDATGRGNPDYGNPQPGQIVALTNGRMAGLQEAYKIGTASQPGGYMDRLMEDAATFGIQVESITGKEAPVLVRLYDDAVNARPDIGKMSNAGGSMRMSAQEVARNDARILPDVSSLVIGEHGDLESPENQPFLRGFVHALPANERSEVLDREGRLSQVGMRRIRNAIIHRAYGESSVFGRLVESLDSGMANLSKALIRAAPKVARVKDMMAAGAARDMDVTATLIKAVAEIETMRKNGLSMADFLAQARMFDQLSPELVEVLAFLDANLRSPNRIAAFIELYYQKIEALGDPRTLDMFGAPQISSANVLKMAATAATREVQDDGVNEAGAGLGGGTGSGEILTANASGTPGGETTPRLPGADQPGAAVVQQPASPASSTEGATAGVEDGATGRADAAVDREGAAAEPDQPAGSVAAQRPVGSSGSDADRPDGSAGKSVSGSREDSPARTDDRGEKAVNGTGQKIVNELKRAKKKKADQHAASDKFDAGGLQPGTPEYNAAFDAWLANRESSMVADANKRQRDENRAAIEKRNKWRKLVRDWFESASDGDSITDVTGQEYRIIEKTRKDGTRTKTLVAVDENGNPLPDGRAATGISKVGDRVDGLQDGVLDEDTGSSAPESSPQSFAASLGQQLESGEAKTGKGISIQQQKAVAPSAQTVTAPSTAPEHVPADASRPADDGAAQWNALTPAGRRAAMKAAGVKLPDAVMWEHISDANKQKLRPVVSNMLEHAAEPQAAPAPPLARAKTPIARLQDEIGRAEQKLENLKEQARKARAAFNFAKADEINEKILILQSELKGMRAELKAMQAAQGAGPTGAAPAAQAEPAPASDAGKADPFAGNKLFTSDESKATVSLRGKAAGDMLEMGNGTLYRIAGIDTAANRIRLARNPDQLSERTVLVDQDGYNKLLADHEQTMAEAMAMVAAPAPESLPANLSVKQEPARDQSGNVIQREKLEGDDRYKKSPRYPNEPESHATARADVVDYMNGDIDRPTLMQRLEAANLPEGVIYSITQRMGEDGPSIGEVNAMMARRKAAEAKPEVETKGGDKKPAPKKKPNADKTRGKADPFAGNKLFTSDKDAPAGVLDVPAQERKAHTKPAETKSTGEKIVEELKAKKTKRVKKLPVKEDTSQPAKDDLGAMFDEILAEETAAEARKLLAEMDAKKAAQDLKAALAPVSSRAGQMNLAYRGSRIATLKMMNEQIRKLDPTEAWHDSNIEDAQDLDALQDSISQTLVDLQRAKVASEGGNPATTKEVGAGEVRTYDAANLAEPGERTAGEAAVSAAKNTAAGLSDAIDGLGKLFGGPGTLGMGPVFNEDTYAKAKPLFQQAIAHFKDAGTDIKEAMRAVVRLVMEKFGPQVTENMKPYIVRFAEDVRDGNIVYDESKETENHASDLQADAVPEGSAGQAPADAATRRGNRQPLGAGMAGDGGGTGASGDLFGSPDQSGAAGARSPDDATGDESPGAPRDRAGDGVEPGASGDVTDHIIDAEDIGKGGLSKKYRDNLAAIRILKAMADEGRVATPEERKQIARYVGWGALKGVFDPQNKQWSKEYAELKELLTDAEYKAARASTLNAHYTSPTVVGGIYEALDRLGFTKGRVLEPSVGTGNFFGLMPAKMRKASQLHGVELDPLTSQIAAALYPSAKIAKATGFQDFQVPAEYFDLAIGNPPFGSEPLVDEDRSPYSGASIHNYFFAKSIDKLRPGGLLAMVVSHNFLDAKNDTTRRWIAERANLVSAVRLPRTAFKDNAGTEVVTDILIFQKKTESERVNGLGDASWVNTTEVRLTNPKTGEESTHRISSYFEQNPSNVLGTPTAGGSMYRANEYTVEPLERSLEDSLTGWVNGLPQGIYQAVERTHEPEAADVAVPDGIKVGSYFVANDGSVQIRGNDVMGNRTASAWTAPNAKAAERMKGMIGLRDALRAQMRLEKSPDATEDQIEAHRRDLNAKYDAFQKSYGYLNDPTNRRIFLDDTESALLLALEFDYDKGVSKAVAEKEGIEARAPSAVKADIFKRRVMFPPADNINVSNAKDALLASLNYKGRLDLDYMASLYDKPQADIVSELGDVVFDDPLNGLVMADEYLSGDVKTKLAEAEAAARDNPVYKRNVDALKKVIPANKRPSEIHAALGAPFIPAELFEQFAKEVTGATMKMAYIKATGQWIVDQRSEANATLNVGKWGIGKMPATAIFARTMAGQGVVVTETLRNHDGSTTTVVLERETEAAREKQAAMKAEWQRWLWADADRADMVADIYNEKMNRIVPRKYDGSHMTFPGMSPAIELLPHQKNAVWRALQSRQVLLDHVVGAGKTFEVVALFMEMRRLGIARKPFIAVPNHLTLQWRSEFSRLYPAANVLAATPDDFAKGNREKFFSKIITGDWDAVIAGHSSLKKIALPPETEKAVLEEQITEIASAIEDMKRARGDRNIIRYIEGIKARLEARMKQRLQALGERDKVVTFDELGVDAFAIDELHEFKNLFYNSTMERVPGMGNPSGSDKAFDLFVKLRWMFDTFGDKAPIIGATGTPVSNSLVEMFNMQRFLQYPMLKREGLHVFDAWAKQFGSVESLYEVSPSGTGYRQSSRFAKFKNLPALMAHYQTFADTVTLDDLKAQEEARGKAFPVPKVAGGRPVNVVAKRSPQVARFMGVPELDIKDGAVQFGFNVARGDEAIIEQNSDGTAWSVQVRSTNEDGQPITMHLGSAKTEEDARLILVEAALSPKIKVDPESILGKFGRLRELNKETKGKVNALSLTGLANKAGLDYRLIDPSAPDFAGSKINLAVDRMMSIYHQWAADKGTQLVFCDLSVPLSSRSGFGSKERRIYVRDNGAITHKRGTMHTVAGHEDLPFFLVKEGSKDDKSFAIYDAATGLRVHSGLPAKDVAIDWAGRILADDAKRQRWIDARDNLGDITQDEIDDYNNANEIDTEETEAISLADIAGVSGATGFSVYDDIKAKLIAKGVPEREIAFIHDYSTPVAKDKLFKAVNAGNIRFLLGSTPKMGAGTNVQKRLVALHHIDAPWRPSDLEQREGRIIRRGNELYERDPENFEVAIFRYATEQTYDTRRWQILEHKARGIEQLRKYDGTLNEIDDIEGEAANSADMKAAASGDPLILEETQLRNEVRRLEALQASHADESQSMVRRARDQARFANEWGPRYLAQFEQLKKDADAHPVKKDEFAGLAVDGGKRIGDRDEAVKAIKRAMDGVLGTEEGGSATFTYRGIEFSLTGNSSYAELESPTGQLDSFRMQSQPMPSAAGFLTRFANYINRIPAHIEELKSKIAEASKAAKELRDQSGKPFEHAADLIAAREAHKKVQRALMRKGPDVPDAQKPAVAAAIEHQKQRLDDLGFGDAVRELLGGVGETRFSRADQQEGQPFKAVDTESAEFKRWFGDWEGDPANASKVIDPDTGEPLVVYHGTNADFNEFDPEAQGSSGQGSGEPGFFFEASPDNAGRYTRQGGGANVMPVYLSLKNPLVVERTNGKYDYDGSYSRVAFANFIDDALELGHDGVIFRDVLDRGKRSTQYVAFRPEQIKSAIGNTGEFSADNPDIRYYRGNRGGVHAEDMVAAVKALRAAFPGLQFHPLEQESQAPDELLNAIKAAGGDVAAAMHKGEVYLFAPSLKDASDVLNRGLHEAVHVGLARMFGTALDPLLLDIHRSNVKVQLRAARIKAKYRYSMVRSVEEVLADMGPEAKSLKGWQKLIAWVRSKLRAAGLVRDWSDADIEALVLRALAAAKKPADTHIARGSVFAEKPVTIDEKPKFSRTEQPEPEPSSIDIRNATLQRVEEILRRKASGETIIDTMIRVPMQAVGIDKVTRLGGKVVRKIIDVAPESIKAGMVSDYGNPDDAINHRDAMFGHQRRRLRGVAELMERMAVMSREESRVAYEWLNNRNADELLESLPEKSRADMIEIKQQIDDLGKEAVDLGLLSVDAYEAHKGAYVHRSYRKWDIDSTKGERTSREYTKQILGEQFKTRGLTELVPMVRVQNTNPTFWKRKIKTGTADHGLRGEQFIRFERHKKAVGTASLPGVEGAEQAGKVVEVQYWPASEPVPARYGAWHQAGTFTVRGTKGDKLIMNRDWTKSEREKMGEIEDARYAIAKTFHQMIHDIEVAKYLQWIAGHYGKEVPPRGVIPVKASESMRNVFGKDDWVQVPNSTVGDTTIKRYGKLSGLYIPGPIWNDIRQVANHNYQPFGETYANILKAWKLSKTALSPGVHTNNIVSNFVMADWHDVRAGDVLEALHIIVRQKDPANKELLGRFEDSGGTIGMYTLSEIKRDQLEPLIEQLRADVAKVGELHGMVGAGAALQSLLHGRMKEAYEIARSTKSGRMSAAVVKKMMDLYEDEDTVFRLAAFIKAKRNGATDLEAGKIARRSFLDYNINAPWIQAMRQTAFPFISFTYRAVPMLLEIIETKPWKIAKLAAFAGLLNALGYALSGGDEDKERRYLPNEKSGRVWGIVPKLIRMPWNDANDSPVFLDIRRWIPVGDVLDTGQSHAALPLIPVVIPGGPVALLAELLANKSQFTGKEITKRTDTAGEKTAAVIEHLFKAFAPNLFFLPGTYAATSVVNAGTGRTDVFGREQSVGMALASGIGIKLAAYPTDVLQRNATLELKSQLREINENMYGLGRERAVGGLSDADFSRKIQRESEKRKRLVEEFQRR